MLREALRRRRGQNEVLGDRRRVRSRQGGDSATVPYRARLPRQRPIPAGAYWGVYTARALENFTAWYAGVRPPDAGGRPWRGQAGAVRANRELGLVDARCAEVIERACQEVRDGLLDNQFVLDVLQGGAGTSTNMNANEPTVRWSSSACQPAATTSCCTRSTTSTGAKAPMTSTRQRGSSACFPRSTACRSTRSPRPVGRSPASSGRCRRWAGPWERPQSAPASPRIRPTGKRSAATFARSPVSRWSARST